MALALLVDFGSTFTKLTLIDLAGARLVARTATPTTADITDGLQQGLRQLEAGGFAPEHAELRLACSSAAGGLRVAAVGLVPDLTGEASRRAALGAGARVTDVFTGLLGEAEVDDLCRSAPDMVLMAGGTDGGNGAALLHNAQQLARNGERELRSSAAVAGPAGASDAAPRLRDVPVVLAGNRDAMPGATKALQAAGFDVRPAANVMPRLGVLDVEPAREAMRRLFFERIVRAKGLDGAQRFVEGVLMPTPAAVLAGARLLAEGTSNTPGWGDVVVVDVGGATTDVHSVGHGIPEGKDVTTKGLPEPFVKRTVEGDLGVRVSALALTETAGISTVLKAAHRRLGDDSLTPSEFRTYVDHITARPEQLPRTATERAVDLALAATAVEWAARRHGGRLEERMTALGLRRFITGKDLRSTACLIGTGGMLVHGGVEDGLLQHALYSPERPHVLLPNAPRMFADTDYVLSACGLLAERAPEPALQILQTHMRRFGTQETER